jgi:hypothetical protein
MKPALLALGHERRLRIWARLLPLVVLAGFLACAGSAAADLANTLTTTTAVAPGGTLVTAVPSGVTISASADVAGCPSSGVGTSSVTYTCDAQGAGMAAGQSIAQTFSAGARTDETVTYNANGPSPASIEPVQGRISPGSCVAGTASNEHALAVPSGGVAALLPDSWSCSGTANAGPGPLNNFLQAVVLANPGQTVQIITAPNGLTGGCAGYGFVLPTASADADAQVHYQCPDVSIPGGWNVTLAVQTSGGRTAPAFELETTSTPEPAGVAPPIPAPTTQTLRLGYLGPGLPVISLPTTGVAGAFAQPASDASAAPVLTSIDPATGAAGATVTLTGTNLASGDDSSTTVTFGTTQAAGVACSADGTSCTATAPALDPSAAVSVTLTNAAGTSNALTFTPAAPPSSGGS